MGRVRLPAIEAWLTMDEELRLPGRREIIANPGLFGHGSSVIVRAA